MVRGERVVLREKRLGDALNDYTWRCDPELSLLDATVPLQTSLSEFFDYYAQEIQDPHPQRRRFAIEDLAGRHIGNCTYYDIDEGKGEAELGIVIGNRDYWDKGYGADAVTTLVRYIFRETGLKRLYLSTLDWNQRALRCFEKCGFAPCERVNRMGKSFVIMEIYRDQVAEKGEAKT